MVKKLLELGADPNFQQEELNGMNALIQACKGKNLKLVKLMIENFKGNP